MDLAEIKVRLIDFGALETQDQLVPVMEATTSNASDTLVNDEPDTAQNQTVVEP